MKNKLIIGIVFILVFSVVIVRSQIVPSTDNDARSFMHGDGTTDTNTLSAIRHFWDKGFLATSFRPIHDYKPGVSAGHAYTHSPALPDVLWGWGAQKLGKYNHEPSARIFPIIVSLFWFFLIFAFYKRILPNKHAALLSSLILVSSSYFVLWADSLYKGALEEIFKIIYVWGLWFFYQSRSSLSKKRKVVLILSLSAIGFLISNTSPDAIAFCAFFTVALACFYEKTWKKLLSPISIILGLGFISGFVFHLYLNALYFGSWNAAMKDILEAGAFRAGTCGDEHKCGVQASDLFAAPFYFINRLERHYLLPGWAVLIFGYWSLKSFRASNPELFKLGIALLIATPAWFFLMPQHALVHHFIARNWGLLYGFVVGTGILIYGDILKSHWQNRKWMMMPLHALFVLYCVGMMITQQLIPIYWTFSFSRL